MKKLALKTYGKIIGAILSIFGLMQSCDVIDPKVEYGTPSADYIVKGNVTDAHTLKPVQGIGIIVPNRVYPKRGDTVYTDVQGNYSLQLDRAFPYVNEKMKVIAKDLDGEKNGVYESDSLELSFTTKDQIKKGDGHWYSGTFEKTNQNFYLRYTQLMPMYGIRSTEYTKKKKVENNM